MRNRRITIVCWCVNPPIFQKSVIFRSLAAFCARLQALGKECGFVAPQGARLCCASKIWTQKQWENGVRGAKFGVQTRGLKMWAPCIWGVIRGFIRESLMTPPPFLGTHPFFSSGGARAFVLLLCGLYKLSRLGCVVVGSACVLNQGVLCVLYQRVLAVTGCVFIASVFIRESSANATTVIGVERGGESMEERLERLAYRDKDHIESSRHTIQEQYYSQFNFKPDINAISKQLGQTRTIHELHSDTGRKERLESLMRAKQEALDQVIPPPPPTTSTSTPRLQVLVEGHVVASCGWMMWMDVECMSSGAASCTCMSSTCMSSTYLAHACLMLTCPCPCARNAPSSPKSARPTRVSQACATHQCQSMPRASTPTLPPWSSLSHALHACLLTYRCVYVCVTVCISARECMV